jgi:hypothetical protein
MLLAGVMALALAQTGLAAGRKAAPPPDPITNPSLNEIERTLYTGTMALTSALMNSCTNIPYQIPTQFAPRLGAYMAMNGVPKARVDYIIDLTRSETRLMSCDEAYAAFMQISANFTR